MTFPISITGIIGQQPGAVPFPAEATTLRTSAGNPNVRVVSVGNVTSTQITGLQPGNTYKIRVRALDASGNVSAWSDEVLAVTTTSTTTTQSFGAVTSGQLTGLTPATGYTARIRARDAAGNWSDWSTPAVGFTTTAAGPTVVAGPARPVARSGTVQLEVTATPPGGQTITSHSWAIVGGGAGSLTNATTSTPTYTAPGTGAGVVTVRDTVTASGGGVTTADVLVSYGANVVAAENALTGTPRATWDLSSPNLGGVSTLQGFCDGFTINRTETANFKIAQSDTAGWTAEVFRLGWYNGDGARSYGTLSPNGTQLTASQSQPSPGDADANTTLLSADAGNWSTTLTWTPPAWAPSGIYVLRLNRTGGGASHVMFIVRDDARRTALTFMPADSTWNAYNAWGGMGSGQYAGNSLYFGTAVNQYAGDCARFVSYNRPVVNRGAADAGRTYGAVAWSTFFTSEYGMLRFVERNGIDTKYLGCIDSGGDPTGTHLKGNGSTRAGSNAAIFVGHNEYWSDAMRSGWESARDAGVSVFSCAGNEVFWRTVGSSPDADGRPRLIECFKSTIASRASTGRTQWTGSWRDPDGAGKGGNAPENTFTGTIFVVNGPDMRSLVVPFAGGYSAQPLWRGTTVASLTTGQSFTSPSQILGFEWDTYGTGGVSTTGNNYLAPAHARARFCSDATYAVSNLVLTDAGDEYGSGNATHRLVVYPGGSGAIVFGTGTVNWALGVDNANTYQQGSDNVSAVLQQATLNILTDMGAPPATTMSGLTTPSPVTWFADAAASLSVTATLTASASRTGATASSLAVTATLTAAATRTARPAAGLAVTATLTTAPARTTPVDAALAVTATLATTATGSATAGAESALSITATLDTGADRIATQDAALPVTATLSTALARTAPSAAALPVTATLTTAGQRTATTAAALVVLATLTTVPTASRSADASLPVVATLFTGTSGDNAAQSALAVVATLSTTAAKLTPAGSALAITASLAAGALRTATSSAALPVVATLTTAAFRTGPADASLPITATATTAGVVGIAPVAGAGSLAITASLATDAARIGTVGASISVTATLSATIALTPARIGSGLAVTVTITTTGAAFGLRTVAGSLAVVATLAASLMSNSDVKQFVVVDSSTRARNFVEPGRARLALAPEPGPARLPRS